MFLIAWPISIFFVAIGIIVVQLFLDMGIVGYAIVIAVLGTINAALLSILLS